MIEVVVRAWVISHAWREISIPQLLTRKRHPFFELCTHLWVSINVDWLFLLSIELNDALFETI